MELTGVGFFDRLSSDVSGWAHDEEQNGGGPHEFLRVFHFVLILIH